MSERDWFGIMKDDDDKAYVRFSYRAYGKSLVIDNEYDADVCWPEVLGDVIKALEAQFGYTFDLSSEELGIYAPGRDKE